VWTHFYLYVILHILKLFKPSLDACSADERFVARSNRRPVECMVGSVLPW
jgi:hypothetical protein